MMFLAIFLLLSWEHCLQYENSDIEFYEEDCLCELDLVHHEWEDNDTEVFYYQQPGSKLKIHKHIYENGYLKKRVYYLFNDKHLLIKTLEENFSDLDLCTGQKMI